MWVYHFFDRFHSLEAALITNDPLLLFVYGHRRMSISLYYKFRRHFFYFMENLSDYFNEEEIVRLLCSYRSKYSHKRHKLHMMRDISLHKSTNKIEVKGTNPEFDILQKIFPSRRNWLRLNEYERKKYNDSIKMKVYMTLFKSIPVTSY